MSEVLYDHRDGVARVTINRPEARNSLTGRTVASVYDAVRRAADDPKTCVLVLRGTGADFCCGADVKGYSRADAAAEATPVEHFDPVPFRTSVLLHEMEAVTIAAIRGGCAGAGFGWACACDLRVADANVRFNSAFLDVGVAGDMGVPWTLPRIVGAGRARELSLLPRKFGAVEALAWGLVNRVFEGEAFEDELDAIVARLAGAAPLALKALKSNYVEAERVPLSTYITMETERHRALFATADRAEAFAAFAEKRAPRFVGR